MTLQAVMYRCADRSSACDATQRISWVDPLAKAIPLGDYAGERLLLLGERLLLLGERLLLLGERHQAAGDYAWGLMLADWASHRNLD
jgi:hypothetical protein